MRSQLGRDAKKTEIDEVRIGGKQVRVAKQLQKPTFSSDE
jgi:hypothetical protein